MSKSLSASLTFIPNQHRQRAVGITVCLIARRLRDRRTAHRRRQRAHETPTVRVVRVSIGVRRGCVGCVSALATSVH
jgi:hypothetical protein